MVLPASGPKPMKLTGLRSFLQSGESKTYRSPHRDPEIWIRKTAQTPLPGLPSLPFILVITSSPFHSFSTRLASGQSGCPWRLGSGAWKLHQKPSAHTALQAAMPAEERQTHRNLQAPRPMRASVLRRCFPKQRGSRAFCLRMKATVSESWCFCLRPGCTPYSIAPIP